MKKIIFSVAIIMMVVLSSVMVLGFANSEVTRLIRTRTCEGCTFYRENFNGIDLTGVNLRGAYLKYATFRKATLYNADLTGAEIEGADFAGALWIDGDICQFGSVGKCLKKKRE